MKKTLLIGLCLGASFVMNACSSEEDTKTAEHVSYQKEDGEIVSVTRDTGAGKNNQYIFEIKLIHDQNKKEEVVTFTTTGNRYNGYAIGTKVSVLYNNDTQTVESMKPAE